MDPPIRYPKHKRGRRKKFQMVYQEQHKEEMIQQLGRRFHNQPSTSAGSPTRVEEIPLPSEIPDVFGAPPPLTASDYDTNFLVDPEVVSTHSASILRSNRKVLKAEEAEHYLMVRAGTTADKVLEDFRMKILNPMKTKRSLQTHVPYIEHPSHSTKHKHSRSFKNEEESSNDSESDSESSTSDSEEEGTEKHEGSSEQKSLDRRSYMLKKRAEKKEKDMRRVRMGFERKKTHPNRVDSDICFNEKGLANDGPECRCPTEIRNRGIKHGYYAGENCVFDCRRNHGANLHYYTLQVTPAPNESQQYKTRMTINGEDFLFEGFSMITHSPLPDCMTRRPICKYSLDYEFHMIEEKVPDGCFHPEECNDLYEYIFHEIFEMLDFDVYPKNLPAEIVTCPIIHIMPRFVATRANTAYLWSTKAVLAYFIMNGEKDMFCLEEIEQYCEQTEDVYARNMSRMKQSIVLNPLRKPSSLRADFFDRDVDLKEMYLIHNSIKPSHYSTEYLPKIAALERKLNKMKMEKKKSRSANSEYEGVRRELDMMKERNREARNLKLKTSVEGYMDTGLKPDVVAHIAMAIIASHHIRYNFSLSVFEDIIEYRFNDRRVIELALIHSSFRTHYGTTPDHVKNMISNCGYRRKYGSEEKREKKKGVVNLFSVMGGETSGGEPILHNERLEYLGDAVVELITSHHLYFMLTHHFEGGLATYRTALVQNRNLATLAMNCRMDEMLQYAHGADLINEAEWKHALANSFEALMAAVYLDSGLAPCDKIFSKAMYGSDPELKGIWDHVNEHELKVEDPLGDRDLSYITPALSSFHKLEKMLGIQFNNIRLLAKAFTRRNVPNNDLTKGHNQRLEWLGDSVLQLIISDYLYRNFPLHHEGHMSLLRTSLVSNQTQAIVCDDLGFLEFVVKPPHRTSELKMKDKADLVEAFIGALYVDKGIEYCRSFIRTVFCPRLKHFINSEQWNDAKSHLQQWCLAMRDAKNPRPTMPEYRLVTIEGPTNNRIFTIAVYFRGQRISTASASNVHNAQLRAAEQALAFLEAASFSKLEGNLSRKRRRHRTTFSQ